MFINNHWRNVKECTNVKDIENMHGVTWEELATLELERTELLTIARMVGDRYRRWSDVGCLVRSFWGDSRFLS